MDEALDAMRLTCSSTEYHAAVKLLYTYVKNIVSNPFDEKFRKIRIGNPKFRDAIWNLSEARTCIYLAGFEENGEFLILPLNVDLSHVLDILQKRIGVDSAVQVSQHEKGAIPLTPAGSTILKLKRSEASSAFEEAPKADLTLLCYLVEMGYDKLVAEVALKATGNKGVQPAMDWIDSHPDDVVRVISGGVDQVSEPAVPMQSDESANSLMGLGSSGFSPAISKYQKVADERHKYQEKQRLEAIRKARLDKEEERNARELLKKKMEAERLALNEKFDQQKFIRHSKDTSEGEATSPGDSEAHKDLTTIKVKLPDGKVKVWHAEKTQTVRCLFDFVQASCPDHPATGLKVIFADSRSVLENNLASLEEAGLTPSATVIIHYLSPSRPPGVSETSSTKSFSPNHCLQDENPSP